MQINTPIFVKDEGSGGSGVRGGVGGTCPYRKNGGCAKTRGTGAGGGGRSLPVRGGRRGKRGRPEVEPRRWSASYFVNGLRYISKELSSTACSMNIEYATT